MLQDLELERSRFWDMHKGFDDVGVDPDNCGYTNYSDAIEFWINGPIDASVLFVQQRPLLPTTGHVYLKFEIFTDSLATKYARFIEFDLLIVKDKLSYRQMARINYFGGGNLELWIDGAWKNAGHIIGVLPPYEWHPFRIEYYFDFANRKSSMISISWVETREASIDNFFRNQPAGITAEPDGANVQFGLYNVLGGAWSEKLRNVELNLI